MSSKSGFPIIRVRIATINTLFPSGACPENATILTYVNKGTYLVACSAAYQAGGGTITNSQMVISSNFPYGNGGETILCGQNPTGAQGVTAGNQMRQTLSNMVTITTNNTPIYKYLSCTNTVNWNLTAEGSFNYVIFTKIA